MKKITLLMMLFVASMGLQAQDGMWDFDDNTTQGWTPVGTAVEVVANTTNLKTTIKADGKNKKIENLTVGTIDADTKKAIVVTLKNTTLTDELRILIVSTGGTTRANFNIEQNMSDFKAYEVDLSSYGSYSGAVSKVQIIAGITENAIAGDIFYDKIEFVDAVTPPELTEKHVFNFDVDGDFEGWEKDNGTLTSSAGILTYTPIANWARLTQIEHYVVADDYNWLRIKMKNNSTGDDQFRLISSGGTVNIPITTSDATEQTYEILLDTLGTIGGTLPTTWTGEISGYRLRFSDDSGKSTGTGSFEINSIEFYQAPGLSNQDISKDDIKLNIYPNPVRNYLTVKTSSKVNRLLIYNVTGQEVLRADKASINTSSLTKGVYILKVSLENGNISTKRFVKE